VYLPKAAEGYYREAKEQLKRSLGNPQQIKQSFLRMRQISSGFLGYLDDDSGERAEVTFPENPKLEMLLSLIEEIPPERKIVVHHDFTHSGHTIREALKKARVGTLHLYGGTKDIGELRERFDNDKKERVLLLQNRFSMGPNLQAACVQLFYESPVSVIIRKQAERRVERQHSKHPHIWRYDLVCKGTADERILTFHKQGSNLFKALLRGKVTL
jgi:SNF2 family DNA or RNA helicase